MKTYHYLVTWRIMSSGHLEHQKYLSWQDGFDHLMFLANTSYEVYRKSGEVIFREMSLESIPL